jgi:predicted nucleic-acid-binding protein
VIALDTNILLRYIVRDEPEQTAKATLFIEGNLSEDLRGYISLPVIWELSWSLRKTYALPTDKIVEAVSALLEIKQFDVQEPEIVRQAIANQTAGIADMIIHLIGQANGCSKTVTLDKKFARLKGVELLIE